MWLKLKWAIYFIEWVTLLGTLFFACLLSKRDFFFMNESSIFIQPWCWGEKLAHCIKKNKSFFIREGAQLWIGFGCGLVLLWSRFGLNLESIWSWFGSELGHALTCYMLNMHDITINSNGDRLGCPPNG